MSPRCEDRRDLAHSGVTLNLTLLSGCFQFRQPHPTVARITAIHLTRILPPHCGPDHGDPPHKGFATPLWPGSRRSTSQGFCHPTVARITAIHLTRNLPPHLGPRSRRSTSQGFCHPVLAPDHVDPPHKGFATPSWPQITSIHLTRVLPPHPGPRSRRSTSQEFCHQLLGCPGFLLRYLRKFALAS